jgi:lysyl-tRNA synthetase class 1
MFWADRTARDIEAKLSNRTSSGKPLVIRDEKTASGRVHVGAMRTISIHALIGRVLVERGVPNTFRYEINDFDAFDTVPAYVPQTFDEHLGKPLFAVPSPESTAENYARFFGEQYLAVVRGIGIEPEVYYSSDEYRKGSYNEAVVTALTRADDIRGIYKKVSGSDKEGEWLPIMMICEQCDSIATTRPISFDGEKVSYVCDAEAYGRRGCGFSGARSPFDGNAKLPWKVEWAAKFKVHDVAIEGEGKDLATKGGARDVANHISREVFEHEPPYDIPHEFFLIGGRKMSTSKGTGASAVEVNALMPPQIFRLALVGKEPKRAVDFDPEGDTLSLLYDLYDTIAGKYWGGAGDDNARLFELVHQGNPPSEMFLPRFSQVAFLVQMPHMDLLEEAGKIKGSLLTEDEKRELNERAVYARQWLERYADEEYKYELKIDAVPEAARGLSAQQKGGVKKVLAYIKEQKELEGEAFHKTLHEIRKEIDLEPRLFFEALYLAFLGKPSGPKAGWFLSVLPRDFLIERLEAIAG